MLGVILQRQVCALDRYVSNCNWHCRVFRICVGLEVRQSRHKSKQGTCCGKVWEHFDTMSEKQEMYVKKPPIPHVAVEYIQFSKAHAHQWGYIYRPWRGALSDSDTKITYAYRDVFNSFYCRTYAYGMYHDLFRGRPKAGDFESLLIVHWVPHVEYNSCRETRTPVAI